MTEDQKGRIREWVRRLRSDAYRQGRVYLHRIAPDGQHYFSVYGVACEIALEEGVCETGDADWSLFEGLQRGPEFAGTIRRYGCDDDVLGGGWTDSMPTSVRQWLGLPSNDLSRLKVFSGTPFEEAAAAIERAFLSAEAA